MSEKHPATIKYKNNKKQVNIGLIICIMIILYFVAYFYNFLFNKDTSFYEVTTGTTSSSLDGQYKALALRSESVVDSAASGYVNFFIGDETPIYVGEQAYLIDASGELSASLQLAAQTQALLNENDLSVIEDSLYSFKTSFQTNEYYETYTFKYQIESQILDLVNSSIFDGSQSFSSGNYSVYQSELAGVAVHYVDGLESVTIDSFDASSFKKNDYRKTIIRSNDYVEAGSPVYKVITSEDWYLVLQIEDPAAFSDMAVVSIEFLKDSIQVDADFELIARGGNYYGIITLNKYMIRYASERYLQIAFTDNTESGLKIPKSSVTTRAFYAIPKEYAVQGGNSSNTGFLVQTVDEYGETSAQIRYPIIVREDDEFYYISTDDSQIGYADVLLLEESSDEFPIGMTAELEGAYVASGGKAYFCLVDILGESDGYLIIDEDTTDGIRLYDQVYIDYKDAEDDD